MAILDTHLVLFGADLLILIFTWCYLVFFGVNWVLLGVSIAGEWS